MNHRIIILQTLESWLKQLPVETQTGASIATKDDIVRLSEQLSSRLAEDKHQIDRWLSTLVELYSQARLRSSTTSHLSNIPSIQRSASQ
jgi:hypothetical protein